jgi:hypothetical protein
MDAKAKAQEIYDRVSGLESNQAMLNRLFEIVMPKLNGEEYVEVNWICTWLDTYLAYEVFIPKRALEDGGKDFFFFGDASGPTAVKTYPTLATMIEIVFDPKTEEPRDPDQSGSDRDALYLQAIDHDRAHPGVGLVAGTC